MQAEVSVLAKNTQQMSMVTVSSHSKITRVKVSLGTCMPLSHLRACQPILTCRSSCDMPCGAPVFPLCWTLGAWAEPQQGRRKAEEHKADNGPGLLDLGKAGQHGPPTSGHVPLLGCFTVQADCL